MRQNKAFQKRDYKNYSMAVFLQIIIRQAIFFLSTDGKKNIEQVFTQEAEKLCLHGWKHTGAPVSV